MKAEQPVRELEWEMGFAMANQMGQMFTGSQNTPQTAGTPPPVPGAVSYFVVQKGQQTGPFDMNALRQMAQTNVLTRESLVWKKRNARMD